MKRRPEGPLMHSLRLALLDMGVDVPSVIVLVVIAVMLGASLFGNQ